jgi:hypothetical protein
MGWKATTDRVVNAIRDLFARGSNRKGRRKKTEIID